MINFLDKTGLAYLVDKLKKYFTDTLFKDVVLLKDNGGSNEIFVDDVPDCAVYDGKRYLIGGRDTNIIYYSRNLTSWDMVPGIPFDDLNDLTKIVCGKEIDGRIPYLISAKASGHDLLFSGTMNQTGETKWSTIQASLQLRDVVFLTENIFIALAALDGLYVFDDDTDSLVPVPGSNIEDVIWYKLSTPINLSGAMVIFALGYTRERTIKLEMCTYESGDFSRADRTPLLNGKNIEAGDHIITYMFNGEIRILIANWNKESILVNVPVKGESISNYLTIPVTNMSGFAFGNNTLVCVGFGSTAAYSVDGGESWQTAYLPYYGNWSSVIFDNKRFVIFGGYMNPRILTSENGIDWEYVTKPAFFNLSGENITNIVNSALSTSLYATKEYVDEKTNFDYGLLTVTDLIGWATNTAKRSGSFRLNTTTVSGLPTSPGYYIGRIEISGVNNKLITMTQQDGVGVYYNVYYNGDWSGWTMFSLSGGINPGK